MGIRATREPLSARTSRKSANQIPAGVVNQR
jgi:hypothetical protein